MRKNNSEISKSLLNGRLKGGNRTKRRGRASRKLLSCPPKYWNTEASWQARAQRGTWPGLTTLLVSRGPSDPQTSERRGEYSLFPIHYPKEEKVLKYVIEVLKKKSGCRRKILAHFIALLRSKYIHSSLSQRISLKFYKMLSISSWNICAWRRMCSLSTKALKCHRSNIKNQLKNLMQQDKRPINPKYECVCAF